MSIDHRPHRDPIPKTVSDPLTQDEIDERDNSRRLRRKITAIGAGFVVLAAGGGTAYAMTRGGETSPAPAAGSEPTPGVPTADPSVNVNLETNSAVITTPETPATSAVPTTAEAPATPEAPIEAGSMSPERYAEIDEMTYEQFAELDGAERVLWGATTIKNKADDAYSRLNSARITADLPQEKTPFTEGSLNNTPEEIMTQFYVAQAVITGVNSVDLTTYTYDEELGMKTANGWLKDSPLSLIEDPVFNQNKGLPKLGPETVLISDQYDIAYSTENLTQSDGTVRRQFDLIANVNNRGGAPFLSLTFEFNPDTKSWVVIFWNEFDEKPATFAGGSN